MNRSYMALRRVSRAVNSISCSHIMGLSILRPYGMGVYKSSTPFPRQHYLRYSVKRLFFEGSNKAEDLYAILDVPKTATEKEIKIAYFKQAKKYHPDLNPNDPKARENFQKVSNAYEILSNPSRRRQYDMTGTTGTQYTSSSSSSSKGGGFEEPQYTYTSQQRAEDMFRSVSEDVDVIKEAMSSFLTDIQDEFSYAAECASRGDWKEVWEVVKVNKGIVFGFIVPLALLFRFPALVIAAGRLLLFGTQFIVLMFLRQGQLHTLAGYIWKLIVNLAKERNRRRPRK